MNDDPFFKEMDRLVLWLGRAAVILAWCMVGLVILAGALSCVAGVIWLAK